jgi:hypothetical protein
MPIWQTRRKDKKLPIQRAGDKKLAIRLLKSNWSDKLRWASFNKVEPNLYQDSFWFLKADHGP